MSPQNAVRPIIVPEQMVEAQSAKANWNSQCASTGMPVAPKSVVAVIPWRKNQACLGSLGSCQPMKPLPAPNMKA